MSARDLSVGDAFLYGGKLYNVKKLEFLKKRIRVITDNGTLRLKYDEQLYMF